MRHGHGTAAATWMLERLSAGLDGRALAGDLLEELEAGHTAGWFWRQVMCAVAVNALAGMRRYGLPLVFAAGWSLLYPMWIAMGHGFVARLGGMEGSSAWPYSVLLGPMFDVLPVAGFVWIGVLAYLLLPGHSIERLSVLRIVVGLSVGLNVLLLAAALLMQHAMPHGMDLHNLTIRNFYSNIHWMVGIPLVSSLYVAILWVWPRASRRAVAG